MGIDTTDWEVVKDSTSDAVEGDTGYSKSAWIQEQSDKPDDLDRLIFLLANLRVNLPGIVAQALPFGEHLRNIDFGIGTVGDTGDVFPMYSRGQLMGAGSTEELVQIILRLSQYRIADWPADRSLQFHKGIIQIEAGSNNVFSTAYEEVDMVEAMETDGNIPKYFSGFAPFDAATKGGFYQGLVVLLAMPGSGKTSSFISLSEGLLRSGIPVWFFENEIPALPMGGRVKEAALREPKFLDRDYFRLFCGPYSGREISEKVMEDPDPNRVIIFDTPDIVFESGGGDPRHDITSNYRHLIKVKSQCRTIFVPSQPKNVQGELQLGSMAEAWQKAWYADIVLTLEASGTSDLKVACKKNRFGELFGVCYYRYDYRTMKATLYEDQQDAWERWS